MRVTTMSNLTCPHCGELPRIDRYTAVPFCVGCDRAFGPEELGQATQTNRDIHKIGCQYWRDMDNGSPSITCGCGLWAAERQEMEAELGCPCVGTTDQEDCPGRALDPDA